MMEPSLEAREELAKDLRDTCERCGRAAADAIYAFLEERSQELDGNGERLSATLALASESLAEAAGEELTAKGVVDAEVLQFCGIIVERAFFARLIALDAAMGLEGGHA